MVPALGYARRSGIPFEMGLIRNHYVGRTFIEPQSSIRHFGVSEAEPRPGAAGRQARDRRRRLDRPWDDLAEDSQDDPAAGAKEIHLRIASPPVISPCYYGIDTPTRAELLASSHTQAEIARYLTADSVVHLSREGLARAAQASVDYPYCTACFTGDYPIRFTPPTGRRQLRLVEF